MAGRVITLVANRDSGDSRPRECWRPLVGMSTVECRRAPPRCPGRAVLLQDGNGESTEYWILRVLHLQQSVGMSTMELS